MTKEICSIVDGPVSAEVVATEYGQMMKEAEVLSKIADNICIKVPLTLDGLKACRTIRTQMNRLVNVTLCFSANQALLAAKAGASFISPFVGRIDDTGSDGMELISEIRQIYDNYDYPDRDPHRLGPHREPCEAGGADRRGCHHRAAGHAEGSGQPPADRQGARGFPGRLGQDRPEDRLKHLVDAATIASTVLAAIDGGRQVEPFTAQDENFSEADAYAVTAKLRELRIARGEKPIGRKIGFTNRNIWAEYGVFQPIWGDVYDTTVMDVSPGDRVEVSQLPEPRIEPEIVLGLERDLTPGMGVAEIAQAVGWVAHGFEFVQSIFPAWRFQVADCVADGGLHGRLFVGPRRQLSDQERGTLAADLSGLTIRLSRNGALADTGSGANVLDGPVQALAHLVAVLGKDRLNPPLRAGEIITTGTLTRAFPVLPGERWSTEIEGFDLPGLSVEIA